MKIKEIISEGQLDEIDRRNFIKSIAGIGAVAVSKSASAGLFGPSFPDPGKYSGYGKMSYDRSTPPPIDNARIEILIRHGDWMQAELHFFINNPWKGKLPGEIEERYVEILGQTFKRKNNLIYLSDKTKTLIINTENNAFRFEQSLDNDKRIIIGKIK